ncbi:TIFY domain/Divergent CCT motif family protein, putative isoform 2 [Hibiscus syriacus]|uniref:Protein TIFY n=1 Tax=Hibiscus syriacus TaxID=106335 RepID=A0A6A2Z376_HIBSY|nr:TIFY domain/Divergent CCT motif family protein, putative isoform 2 [Hibiscus syriacus]
MSPGETVSRSPLDKPLNQLTEDDISQVTREDCRRYLKEKGMRRPSWNKSQAIQQVISLKNLLETTSDSNAADARMKLHTPCPEYPPRVVSDSTVLPNEMTPHNGILAPANESIPYPRSNPSKSEFSGDKSGRTVAAGNDSVSPRTAGAAAKEPAGQMTIFYCGKVNVYDDIPGCKAEAILHLAASPVPFPHEILADQRTTPLSIPCHSQAASFKTSPCSPMVIFPPQQTVNLAENCQFPREECNASLEDNLGLTSRKALVQRYLEKKKDRFKNKRKLATSSSPTFDIYLNQMGDQFSSEKQSEPCFSPTPKHLAHLSSAAPLKMLQRLLVFLLPMDKMHQNMSFDRSHELVGND